MPVSEDGEAARLTRGRDEWDTRKREKIVLWKKFANYMTAFGRDQDYPYDEVLSRSSPDRSTDNVAPGNVVTFYQRFGDVGCWLFCDGHFQVGPQSPDQALLLILSSSTSQTTRRLSSLLMAHGVISITSHSKLLVTFLSKAPFLHRRWMIVEFSLTLYKHYSTS